MVKLATICYVDNGKEFLLLHRNKKENDVHQGKWIGVGGKIEAGETPEECAKREIFEETGITATDLRLSGIITFPEFTPDNDWYTYVFRVIGFEGEVREDCPEGTLAWIPYADIPALPTWEGDYTFVNWLLEKKPFFSAKFSYKGDELVEQDVVFYGE